nr:MAG TPA: hypothetical protein [Caudoviricetes sp.]
MSCGNCSCHDLISFFCAVFVYIVIIALFMFIVNRKFRFLF